MLEPGPPSGLQRRQVPASNGGSTEQVAFLGNVSRMPGLPELAGAATIMATVTCRGGS